MIDKKLKITTISHSVALSVGDGVFGGLLVNTLSGNEP